MCAVCGCGGHRGRGLRESVLSELFRSVRVTGALSVLYVRKARVTCAAGDCLTFRFSRGVFVGSEVKIMTRRVTAVHRHDIEKHTSG